MRKGNYASDVHFHCIQIPVDLSKIIATKEKAVEEIINNFVHEKCIPTFSCVPQGRTTRKPCGQTPGSPGSQMIKD
jgi:hypothetical protein